MTAVRANTVVHEGARQICLAKAEGVPLAGRRPPIAAGRWVECPLCLLPGVQADVTDLPALIEEMAAPMAGGSS